MGVCLAATEKDGRYKLVCTGVDWVDVQVIPPAMAAVAFEAGLGTTVTSEPVPFPGRARPPTGFGGRRFTLAAPIQTGVNFEVRDAVDSKD